MDVGNSNSITHVRQPVGDGLEEEVVSRTG